MTLFPKKIPTYNFLPTLDYSAPEYVLDQKPVFLSDVFSFACLYYEILTEAKPLTSNEDINNYSKAIEVIKK
jgi:serine/threonine protein kinase